MSGSTGTVSSVPASASSSAARSSQRSSTAQTDTGKRIILRYRHGRRQDTYKDLELPTKKDPQTITGSAFTSHGGLASNLLAGFSQHQTSYAGSDLALTDGGERLIWTKAKARRNKQDDSYPHRQRFITVRHSPHGDRAVSKGGPGAAGLEERTRDFYARRWAVICGDDAAGACATGEELSGCYDGGD
jgi:hypothetical protein